MMGDSMRYSMDCKKLSSEQLKAQAKCFQNSLDAVEEKRNLINLALEEILSELRQRGETTEN